jgi:MFS family permease
MGAGDHRARLGNRRAGCHGGQHRPADDRARFPHRHRRLQRVKNGYVLTLAAFLLIGGSLGDRFGRRKVYLTGAVWFALASAACGFAPSVRFLIITRVLQGAGAALLTPGSLAILEASFRPADRARAIGAWSGLGGVAIPAGPLVGGYLISAASWRWIFFINTTGPAVSFC